MWPPATVTVDMTVESHLVRLWPLRYRLADGRQRGRWRFVPNFKGQALAVRLSRLMQGDDKSE